MASIRQLGMAIALGLVFVSPTFLNAQEIKPVQDMSEEELIAQARMLARKINDSMTYVENELARLSLPPRRVEEIEAEMRELLESSQAGELTRIPAGLRQYYREHTDELKKLLGKDDAEVQKLLEDSAELDAELKDSSEAIREALQDVEMLRAVLTRETEAEREQSSALEEQQKSAERSSQDMADVLNLLYELASRQQSQQSEQPPEQGQQQQQKGQQGDQKDKPHQTDDKDGKEDTNRQPTPEDAEKQAQTGRSVDANAWTTKRQGKEAERAASGSERGDEPSRFAGFGKAFQKKQTESTKSGESEPSSESE